MIFIVILVTALSFSPHNAHAQSITVHTDKPSYHYGDTYTTSGTVNPVVPNQVITIMILSPNYPHPSLLSVIPNSDGRYSYTLPLTIKDISSGNFTVIAQYGISKSQTTFIYTGVPCSRQYYLGYYGHSAPASNPRIVDGLGNAIHGPVKVGQQIQITYDVANGLNCVQPFAYLVQIQDHNGITVSLSWITGTLLAGQSLNPAQSWTPLYNDTYTAQIFTWQSLDNPNAIAPPVSVTFNVLPDSNLAQSSQTASRMSLKCNEGFVYVIKAGDGSPACVNPDSIDKLSQRGWTVETSNPKTTYMNIKVYGSYTPRSLRGNFLSGMLYSLSGPMAYSNVTLSVNGTVMGTTTTLPDGCFQYDNWNDSKIADKINKTFELDKEGFLYGLAYLDFEAQYLGDANQNPANASAGSYLSFYLPPIAPPSYDTKVYPSYQINMTQGSFTLVHLTVKSYTKYSEVAHMKLNLHQIPCGLSYRISSVGNNDSTLANNTASFDMFLNTEGYTPPGKYWISIDQDLTDASKLHIDTGVGAFILNISKN